MKTNEKMERNLNIFRAREEGKRFEDVAREFGLSSARVRFIYHRYRLRMSRISGE